MGKPKVRVESFQIKIPKALQVRLKAHVKRFGYKSVPVFSRLAVRAYFESNPMSAAAAPEKIPDLVRTALLTYMDADLIAMQATRQRLMGGE